MIRGLPNLSNESKPQRSIDSPDFMKRCPECRRDYFDDSLAYCLDDGAVLVDGPRSESSVALSDEPATALISEARTDQQHSDTERTAILPASSHVEKTDGHGSNKRILIGAFSIAIIAILAFGG